MLPRRLRPEFDGQIVEYDDFWESSPLRFGKDFVKGNGSIYLHSDLLYHLNILAMTVASQAEIALAVERTDCDEEMMKARVDGL